MNLVFVIGRLGVQVPSAALWKALMTRSYGLDGSVVAHLTTFTTPQTPYSGRVGRPQPPPGELGSVRLVEYSTNLPARRWRGRGRMRRWDYSRRDPRSGAYQAGPRIDLTAFAATAKQAESALRRVARDRLVAEAARVHSGEDAGPVSPPLIDL